jgi:mRNA-degrading endonuclease toxin of MazEF toxin-antitoxin module
MAYLGKVFRWELYWADLEPHIGTEQAGDRRPVIVVSNDDANATFGTVTVVPLTKLEGKGRSAKFFEVELPPATIPNGYTSLALPHQIRTISKTRLLEHIGSLNASGARYRVECGILDHLGIDFDDSE